MNSKSDSSTVKTQFAFLVTLEPKEDDCSADFVTQRLYETLAEDFQVDEEFGYRVTCRRILSISESAQEAKRSQPDVELFRNKLAND